MKTGRNAEVKYAPVKKSTKQTINHKETNVKKTVKTAPKKSTKQHTVKSTPVQDKVYAIKGFKPTVKKTIVEALREKSLGIKKGTTTRAKVHAAIEKVGLTWLSFAQHEAFFGLRTHKATK